MQAFEQEHVHEVYEHIASDFSRTRHTPWPYVSDYLNNLPPGSLVLDAGCGNGKYLGCNSVLDNGSVSMVGLDMSQGLLDIAASKGYEVVRGDCIDLSCFRPHSFDHAISIATIHHFADRQRRLEAIRQMLLAVMPASPARTATLLIVVWALEQNPELAGIGSARRSKSKVMPASMPVAGNTAKDEQDVFVPWRFRDAQPSDLSNQTFQRYYHLFKHGELTDLVKEAAASLSTDSQLASMLKHHRLELTLKDNGSERWERENWVAEVSVRWVAS